MRLVLISALLLTVTVSAHADIRYRLRPRLGEMVSPTGSDNVAHPCGKEMQARIWRTLFRYPIVTVHQNGSIDINLGEGKVLPAEDQRALTTGKLISYWATSTPGIIFGASIKERPTLPPRIEIVVIRDSDKSSWCGEKWVGLGDKF